MTAINQSKKHFIIGLTGNIGTGKSTVMKMLRHLGAYGIDADNLTKKAYANEVVSAKIAGIFGNGVIASDGTINRKELAKIVFQDPRSLAHLERLLHPLVSSAAKQLVNQTNLPIIIIEAIKLLESDLVNMCDSIWVVDAQEDTVLERLINQRSMTADEVKERLFNQSSAAIKQEKADIVINNSGHLEETWRLVTGAWSALREKNSRFASLDNETIEKLSDIQKHTVLPFSQVYDKIKSKLEMVEKDIHVHLQPGGEPINYQRLAKLASCHFLFAPSDGLDDCPFSVWDLATFSFACSGHFQIMNRHSDGVLSLNSNIFEKFANLYRSERISIPIHTSLKEEAQILREKGYTSSQLHSPNRTLWRKAGYNLFYMQLWDANTLFKNDNRNKLA